ncbi:MAG: hypothetical protein QUS14_02035, partial [Pyrinomonadaceae bacterium]|nr:hypothetical protein [Pyrinomonadaceae bacterium]
MKRISFFLIVLSAAVASLSLLPTGTSGKGSKLIRSANPVPGRYIVVFDEERLADSFKGAAGDHASELATGSVSYTHLTLPTSSE